MKTYSILLVAIVLVALSMSSCKKDKLDSAAFCADISAYAFDDTADELNTFMTSVCSPSATCTDSVRVDQVKQFLLEQSCVSQVEIPCVSCLQSLPPQSQLKITFSVNGIDTLRQLRIRMSDPMTFSGYD